MNYRILLRFNQPRWGLLSCLSIHKMNSLFHPTHLGLTFCYSVFVAPKTETLIIFSPSLQLFILEAVFVGCVHCSSALSLVAVEKNKLLIPKKKKGTEPEKARKLCPCQSWTVSTCHSWGREHDLCCLHEL